MLPSRDSSKTSAPLDDALSGFERIIWDFDGTLFRLALDWPGLRASIAALVDADAEHENLTALIELCRRRGVERAAFERIASIEARAVENASGLVTEVAAVFDRRSDSSVIVTNNHSRTVQRFFEVYGLGPVPVVGRDMVTRPKPDPEGLERVCALWRGFRAVLVGDSRNDEELARAVGIPFHRVGGASRHVG